MQHEVMHPGHPARPSPINMARSSSGLRLLEPPKGDVAADAVVVSGSKKKGVGFRSLVVEPIRLMGSVVMDRASDGIVVTHMVTAETLTRPSGVDWELCFSEDARPRVAIGVGVDRRTNLCSCSAQADSVRGPGDEHAK